MRTLILSLLLLSCSRHDSGATGLDISAEQAQRDALCKSFDPYTVPRCDRSTFHVLMAAMCNQTLPVQYESPSGKWNRDVLPCYPGDSSSETSRDTYLSLLLTKDQGGITRAVNFAQPLGDTGQPAGGVGNIAPFLPIMRGYTLAITQADLDAALSTVKTWDAGTTGHLTAEYLWATARLRGGLTDAGDQVLKKIWSATPTSPFFSCLYHRFSLRDNDQAGTVALLRGMPQDTGDFGWGSSPWQVHYALTVKCLEGL